MKHAPRKRFGQHFLTDGSVLQRIADAVSPRPGERLVEIGPGLGALTAVLLQRTERLEAVEIDRDLPFEGTPVMADDEFERAVAEIEAICETGERIPAYA